MIQWDVNPGRVLPYVALTGMCNPIGYGFQGVLNGVSISSLSVLNRVSLHDIEA